MLAGAHSVGAAAPSHDAVSGAMLVRSVAVRQFVCLRTSGLAAMVLASAMVVKRLEVSMMAGRVERDVWWCECSCPCRCGKSIAMRVVVGNR